MSSVYLKVFYDIEADTFDLESDIKPEHRAELIGDFLRSQIGAGIDGEEPEKHSIYSIVLVWDLSADRITARSNCGSTSLRDGLLMRLLSKLENS